MTAACRVAIDARRLTGNRRGIGLYVHNLVGRLPRLATDIEFLLLVSRPLDPEAVPRGTRQVVVGRVAPSDNQSTGRWQAMIYSVYWMNVLVPRILEKERVRLFHAANVAVPVLAPCPCVATIHDLVSFRVPGTHGRLYEFYRRQSIPDAARRAARIVAVSESTKRDIEELVGVCPDKIRVIHHGVDDGLAPVADRATLDRARRRFRLPSRFVLHVGAVERQKRLEPLMGAAAAVLRHGLVEGVVLAGEEGPGAADVRREVARLGIAERVHFLGYVTREDLPALYTLARCTVYPSWYEGFGMPVLEAMACGSPVVTSNTSSLPEVAGGAGLLVPPGDSRAIASALERILSDDRFRTELVAKGLVRARQFKWETCAAKHIGVYREVLETPG